MSGDQPRPGSDIADIVRRWTRAFVLASLLAILVVGLRWGGFPWTEAAGVAVTVAAFWWGQSFVFRTIARRFERTSGPDRPG